MRRATSLPHIEWESAYEDVLASAADQLATSLPDLIAREREALMQSVDDQQSVLYSLIADVRSTLQAGTDTANSLNATLETVNRIAARIPARATPSGSFPTAKPFDTSEYTVMLRQLTGTVRELQTFSENAEVVLPALGGVMEGAITRLQRKTDRLIAQILILVVAAIVTTWAGAITYRAAVFRMERSTDMRSGGT
jgi:hypothetical protein